MLVGARRAILGKIKSVLFLDHFSLIYVTAIAGRDRALLGRIKVIEAMRLFQPHDFCASDGA